MAVFSPRAISDFDAALRRMASTFFDKTKLVLSGDEFIAAFIQPDHVPKLKEVQELVGFAGASFLNTTLFDSAGTGYSVQLMFTGSAPVIVPQYCGKGTQPNAPASVNAKLTEWLDERAKMGAAFGDTIDAMNFLNTACGDAQAMSLMLPCLPTIMGQVSDDAANRTVQRARKLTDIKSFGKLPALPPEVRRRLMEVSAIVNSVTLMLDAAPVEAPRHAATVSVQQIKNNPRRDMFNATTTAVFI